MSKSDPNAPRRLALIASKGTLDWAYPPFILATAGAAMGWEVGIFFTFYGLTLLKPKLTAAVSPVGNPAMPMKMPFGPEGFQFSRCCRKSCGSGGRGGRRIDFIGIVFRRIGGRQVLVAAATGDHSREQEEKSPSSHRRHVLLGLPAAGWPPC